MSSAIKSSESHTSVHTKVHITTILLLLLSQAKLSTESSLAWTAQPSLPASSSGASEKEKLRLLRCPQARTAAKGGSCPRRTETFHPLQDHSEASTNFGAEVVRLQLPLRRRVDDLVSSFWGWYGEGC